MTTARLEAEFEAATMDAIEELQASQLQPHDLDLHGSSARGR